MTGIPGVLAAIAAFYHSVSTKQTLNARVVKLETLAHPCCQTKEGNQ